MENKGSGFGVLAIVVSVVAVTLAINASQTQSIVMSMDDSGSNTIVVEGAAERFVAPDVASVSFALVRTADTTAEVTESVNTRMAQLLELLDELGIEKDDIKTTSYDLSPQYSYNDGERTFTGYRLRQGISVKIREIDNASAVLDVVNAANVDNVSGLTFSVEDDEAIMEALRAEAIANAKERAKTLGSDLGVALDQLVGFRESSSDGENSSMMRAYATGLSLDAAESTPTSIATGQNQLKVHVYMRYRLQ